MEKSQSLFSSAHLESTSSHDSFSRGRTSSQDNSPSFLSLKKRGHVSRSWIKIDMYGSVSILKLDKATIMRHCSLPSRDIRLLDPMFIYPSTILGREKAIVVSLEQIRCIITSEEVFLMNSVDGVVVQYKSELCNRLQANRDQATDNLPFEFMALELALELACISLDAEVYYGQANIFFEHWLIKEDNTENLELLLIRQSMLQNFPFSSLAKELSLEIHPVLDELARSISTLNLERVRRFKGYLLGLTQRVQKVHDEIEHLMEDDGDMAEMYLTEKKERANSYNSGTSSEEDCVLADMEGLPEPVLVSSTASTVGSFSHSSSNRHENFMSSSSDKEDVVELEMLLEAYFVVVDHTLSKLSSLKEYIDDTEDLINLKLGNVQNQLIQFELLLAAATFVATIFAAMTAVFGMNFASSVFDDPSGFNWALLLTGTGCGLFYFSFIVYFRWKKAFPV